VYDVVKNIVERKGSVASVVRTREMMRLKFYQSLFLERQREMDSYLGLQKHGGERYRWTMKRMWRRLVGGREDREVKGENKTVLSGIA
jgi:hypothetical protein